MKVPEEVLMAYVDDELDAQEAAAVERAMREDPAVARAVARARALRDRVREAYAPVLREPVPAHLAEGVSGVDRQRRRNRVWNGAMRRFRTRDGRRGRWTQLGALAASLAAGIVLASWLRPGDDSALMQMHAGRLTAGGALADALDSGLAADPAAQRAVALGVTFRTADGAYCRTFTTRGEHAMAGLACREDANWTISALGAAGTDRGELRQASAPLSPAVLAEVDARIDGEALDAVGERAARDRGWK